MKAKKMSVFFFVLIITGSSFANTSDLPPLAFATVKNRANNHFGMFMAHRQGKGVTLSWSFTFPGQVTGYEILRSYDGEFFEIISDMPGSNNPRSKFTDSNVYPGYIHYKVRAVMNDGTVEESVVETIRIVSRK